MRAGSRRYCDQNKSGDRTNTKLTATTGVRKNYPDDRVCRDSGQYRQHRVGRSYLSGANQQRHGDCGRMRINEVGKACRQDNSGIAQPFL